MLKWFCARQTAVYSDLSWMHTFYQLFQLISIIYRHQIRISRHRPHATLKMHRIYLILAQILRWLANMPVHVTFAGEHGSLSLLIFFKITIYLIFFLWSLQFLCEVNFLSLFWRLLIQILWRARKLVTNLRISKQSEL